MAASPSPTKIDTDRLLSRFLSYVRIETTADETSSDYPSSPGQWELGRLLVQELQAMGAVDVRQDNHGLIWGTVPATGGCENAPVIALNSHLDTSPDAPGRGVKPQVVHNYAGGDLILPAASDKVIRVDANPELNDLLGATLITTDGTTLLGGDDKAGVAIIMEIAQHLLEHPEIPHARLQVLFTCDEEIGKGVLHVEPAQVGAHCGYTFDGGGANMIDVETFSADLATVSFHGVGIHPSIAKNRMVSAIRAAGEFLTRLPQQLSPECTADREGFVHPYLMDGNVERVVLKILLRDFETAKLAAHADVLKEAARATEQVMPGLSIDVAVTQQYRNMADGLKSDPRIVALAEAAHQKLGRKSEKTCIRGGTDGAMFTAKGLPMPNLSSGQHNPHSPLEWACLNEMEQAVEVGVELLKLWGQER